MATNPKELSEEQQAAKLRAELQAALAELTRKFGSSVRVLHERIASSPDPDEVAGLARVIALAAYRQQEDTEAERLEDVRAAERMARLQGLLDEGDDAEEWTPETLAEYLASPPEPSGITDEEFDEWLADIYRARKSELL